MPQTKKQQMNKSLPIATDTLQRTALFQRESINTDARTVELAFSSEEPVERWFGNEILDHSPASIRLGRLRDGGPVLVDHDTRDHVGVVDSVSIDPDRRGRAVVRFGKSARAMEIFNDVADGIRKSVSVGYRIHNLILENQNDETGDTYRATDWEPYEVSIVSVPADASVGIGRSSDAPANKPEVKPIEEKSMTEKTTPAEPDQAAIDAARATGATAERARVSAINTLGERLGMADLAREFINNGEGVDAFQTAAIERMASHKAKPITTETTELGMNDKEARSFSILRALHALANPTDRRAQAAAAYEFEASQAAADKMGRASRGITVPLDVLKRDLLVGTATAGGHTVASELQAGSFIDMLRNRSLMMQPGMATVLPDLVGNIPIPRQTGGATGYWVAENGAVTESQQAFDQVTLTPKTVGGFTDISRKLLIQSSIAMENFVRGDLSKVLALALDLAALHGTGTSNQPTGIAATSGIGSVAGGTNGLAPAWSHILGLETEVSIDNADVGSLRYVTNAKVRGKLKAVEKASGTAQFVWEDGQMNGYDAMVTNQVSSTLDKGTSTGVCSAIFFGNWADLLIGMWGGIDINIDTSTGSTAGTVRVVALQDADIAVRHAESFAAMLDALTT